MDAVLEEARCKHYAETFDDHELTLDLCKRMDWAQYRDLVVLPMGLKSGEAMRLWIQISKEVSSVTSSVLESSKASWSSQSYSSSSSSSLSSKQLSSPTSHSLESAIPRAFRETSSAAALHEANLELYNYAGIDFPPRPHDENFVPKIKSLLDSIDARFGKEHEYVLWTDGGAQPTNPGPAASACVLTLLDERTIIFGVSEYFPTPRTNNEAEYCAIILGLTYLLDIGVKHVIIKTDSQLIEKQIKGEYKCRKIHLKAYLDQVLYLKAEYENLHGGLSIEWTKAHAGTAGNEAVDRFASAAIKKRCSLYRFQNEIFDNLSPLGSPSRKRRR